MECVLENIHQYAIQVDGGVYKKEQDWMLYFNFTTHPNGQ